MRIVVLTKPVPDPASGGERLGADGRLDRTNSPAVVNGNDEYVLEKALKLIEAAGDGEVILLTMAPATAPETTPSSDGWSLVVHSMKSQPSAAPAVATKVFIIASVVPPFASRLEPALKPNQPTQSSEAPTMVRVSECGVCGSLP